MRSETLSDREQFEVLGREEIDRSGGGERVVEWEIETALKEGNLT